MTACESGRDYKQAGVNASTTGNITGVYDMSGGVWDRTMGVLVDTSGNPIYSSSGFVAETMPDPKYYDTYEIPTGDYDYTKGKLGDATKEIIKSTAGEHAGWYADYSAMPVLSAPWVYRGGNAYSASAAGLFYFTHYTGSAWSRVGSRAVVVAE